MEEIDRTRFVRAGGARVHRGFSGPRAAVLRLLFGVVSTNFLPEAAETSTRPEIKLSERVSVDQALVRSEQSEDNLWRAREVGIKRSDAGSYRAVSLDEVAQRSC